MSTLYRGEDKLITFTVKDENGAVIDLTTFAGIILEIYSEGGQLIEKYSRETLTGYNSDDWTQLTQSGATQGQFTIRLQSIKTENAIEGCLRFEAKFEETDANYTDSTKHTTVHQTKDTDDKDVILQDSNTKGTDPLA